MATTSPLRQRMIEDMRIRNLSPATQQSYIYAVRRFSRHFGTSPDRLGIEDVRAYQLHLIAKKRSWSHINQAACGLRFFFGDWVKADVFKRLFEAVSDDPDMEFAMVDATIVKVHRRGQGAKGGLRARP